MRALTEAPAAAFGIADRGRLAPGAIANVVVWSGDPMETSSRVERMLVRGREVSLRDRQRLLLDRYRQLPPPAPPRAR
jgi:imidazolonepropionase-like amidohydrolase